MRAVRQLRFVKPLPRLRLPTFLLFILRVQLSQRDEALMKAWGSPVR